MQTLPPCKRCLLEEMADEQALYALIQSRIALLAEHERAADAEYARRLEACKACDQLTGGTCAQCGCYVELRAAKRDMRCPHVHPKW